MDKFIQKPINDINNCVLDAVRNMVNSYHNETEDIDDDELAKYMNDNRLSFYHEYSEGSYEDINVYLLEDGGVVDETNIMIY